MRSFFHSSPHLFISKTDVLNAIPHICHNINNMEELEQNIYEAQSILSPYYTYIIYNDTYLFNDHIQIGNVTLHCGNKIANLLKNSTQIAIAVCTVGEEITYQYQHCIKSTDYLKAYIYDIIANIAISKTMEELKNNLRQKIILQELSITSNFCPGYCDWDIKEQKDLLSLLPVETCPVTLTASSLMQPMKSLSSIIGIGKNVKYKESNCNICNLPQCAYRKQIKI